MPEKINKKKVLSYGIEKQISAPILENGGGEKGFVKFFNKHKNISKVFKYFNLKDSMFFVVPLIVLGLPIVIIWETLYKKYVYTK